MNVKNYKEEEGFDNPHSIEKAVSLQDSEHVKIVHMTLNAGDVVKDHVTQMEVSFFVIEGEVEMKIGEEKQRVTEGSLVESPANVTHGFSNKCNDVARVLVIKHKKTGE